MRGYYSLLLVWLSNGYTVCFGVHTSVPVNGYVDINLPVTYGHTYNIQCTIGLSQNHFVYYFIPYGTYLSQSIVRLKIGRAYSNEQGNLAVMWMTMG